MALLHGLASQSVTFASADIYVHPKSPQFIPSQGTSRVLLINPYDEYYPSSPFHPLDVYCNKSICLSFAHCSLAGRLFPPYRFLAVFACSTSHSRHIVAAQNASSHTQAEYDEKPPFSLGRSSYAFDASSIFAMRLGRLPLSYSGSLTVWYHSYIPLLFSTIRLPYN